MSQISKAFTIAAAAVVSQLFLSGPALADATQWKIDTAHSSANFSVKHMMVSNVRGRFPNVTGEAQYDGKKVDSIKVNAVIDTGSVDTDNDKRDEHLKGKDFFNVIKFPKMKFVSKKIVKGRDGTFKLIGDLTLHGVTKSVTLDVEGPSPAVKAHGQTRVGASATTSINRKDFGISYGGVLDNGGAVVGDDVKVTLDIELVKPLAEKKTEKKTEKIEKAKKKAS